MLTSLLRFLTLVVHHKLRPQEVCAHFAGKVGTEASGVLLIKGEDVVGALALLALAGGHEEAGAALQDQLVLGVHLAGLVPHDAALHCCLPAARHHQKCPAAHREA